MQGLVEDLLRLPEGKLVSGKAKKAALKWLGDAGDDAGVEGGDKEPEGSQRTRDLLLVDTDANTSTVSVMNEASGDVLDGILVKDQALFAQLLKCFEAGDEVKVSVCGGVVLSTAP
jgi:hypothetical protein